MFLYARHIERVAESTDTDHKPIIRHIVHQLRLQIVLALNFAFSNVKLDGMSKMKVLALSKTSTANRLNYGPKAHEILQTGIYKHIQRNCQILFSQYKSYASVITSQIGHVNTPSPARLIIGST